MAKKQTAAERLCDADLERIIHGVVDALKVDCPRPFYTPPQVAKRFRVHAAKVLGWINRGELRAVNIADREGGRARWRIASESLDDFLRRRESSPRPKIKRPKASRLAKDKLDDLCTVSATARYLRESGGL